VHFIKIFRENWRDLNWKNLLLPFSFYIFLLQPNLILLSASRSFKYIVSVPSEPQNGTSLSFGMARSRSLFRIRGPLYHGSLTMAGARLIASAGLTNRGLLSDQLRPVDGRFKLTTTMKTTFGICGSGTCSTASHLYDRIVYIRFHVNGMHIARHKLVNTGNTLMYR